MGNIDCISTIEGKEDCYVLCWFDDNENDFGKAFRRLTGVKFPEGIKCEINNNGKMSCNTIFKAKYGKLE